jgi:hypothetical protein
MYITTYCTPNQDGLLTEYSLNRLSQSTISYNVWGEWSGQLVSAPEGTLADLKL